MIEFNVAAAASEAEEDEDVLEVPIDDVVYKARRPTLAQGALLNSTLGGTGISRLAAAFKLIEGLLGTAAREHVERLVWERRLDFGDLIGGTDENPDGGLIDLIFEGFAERPTQPSDDSSPSQEPVGRRSTGRSQGKGSTRSPSRSTGS